MMNEETMAFGLVQLSTILLKTAAIIFPLVGVVVFVHAWKVWRGGRQVRWHFRTLMLGALIIFAAPLLRTSASVQFTCACANTEPWGSTTLPLALANVGHACKLFSVGVLASAFCLALALGLPIGIKKEKTRTNL